MHLLVNNKTYIVQSIAYVSILKRDLHVQTKANLRKRRVNILDNNYSGLFCFHEEETTNHLFFIIAHSRMKSGHTAIDGWIYWEPNITNRVGTLSRALYPRN